MVDKYKLENLSKRFEESSKGCSKEMEFNLPLAFKVIVDEVIKLREQVDDLVGGV